MKEKFLKNLGIKILSVFAAFFIWLIVVNVDDYTITKQINDIPVEIINPEAITDQDKVYEVIQGDTVDIIIKGRRTIVENLTSEDFKAIADLSQLSLTNAIQISVEPIRSSLNSELTITYVNNTMMINLEEKIEKQLPVTIVTDGKTASGYTVGSKVAAPNMVTIRGAESVIDKVKEVRVVVKLSGEKDDFAQTLIPVFLDEDGDVIDSSKIEIDADHIEVEIGVLKTKEIGIHLETIGEIAEGHELVSTDFQPTTIVVAGDPEALGQINELSVTDIDISGMKEDTELTLDIEDYLPDGIILADDNVQIMLKLVVEKIQTKTFDISQADIVIDNPKDSYNYLLEFVDEAPVVTARGRSVFLDGITLETIRPSIDVSGLSEGTKTVTVVYETIENVELSGEIQVKVTVEVRHNDIGDTSTEKTSNDGTSDE